ncbi:hypothetical protein [Streptomyces sp. NPDC004230]
MAYELLRDHVRPVPLFVTLGSPLALSAVRSRLEFEPKFPAVEKWINHVDRDDVVAAHPNLHGFFDRSRPVGASFESTYTVDNGSSPHDARFYLGKEAVGATVARVLLNE